MDRSEAYDAIVVGSGATGGWAAMDLAERGMRVLVLEAGPQAAPIDPLSVLTRQRAKKRPAWAARQEVQTRCAACSGPTRHLFVDDIDHPYTTADAKPFDWIRGRQVGGRSISWVGHCYRFAPLDLEGADGAAPKWPIRYDELAPFYARVEQTMGMIGTREALPQVPDGEYCETSELTSGEAAVREAIAARWPSRRLIPGRNAVRGPDASGWPRWSSPGSTLQRALATGRVTVRSNAIVTRALIDEASGSARGVAFVDGETNTAEQAIAPFVLLCASSMETVRILMSSTTPQFPDGIGSASGTLGRYIMDHIYTGVLYGAYSGMSGLGEDTSPRRQGAYLPRFQNVDAEPFDFARGYQLHLYVSPLFTRAQLGGDEQAIASVARSPANVVAYGFGEMLPRAENRVTLRHDVRDKNGLPTLSFDCAHGANDLALYQHMRSTLADIAEVTGIAFDEPAPVLPPPPGRAIHEVGGARMGSDGRSSVVDPHGRTWDVPNLYVCDGAAFVTLPCQNPTLTMMALTARACEDVGRAWTTR